MALWNGLPEEYNALISALDAIDEDESKLNFEFLKSRITQDEQRMNIRTKSAQNKTEAAALLSECLGEIRRPSRRRSYCNHCKQPGHIESMCWTNFPHLNPQNNKDLGNKPVFVVNQSEEYPTICLMTEHRLLRIKNRFSVWYLSTIMPRNPSLLTNGSSILDAVTTWTTINLCFHRTYPEFMVPSS